ncbi:MAG TPA: caspase family protein [Xanthobacteraceae bacterium]|jgi:hypothetical protein|nr:caspase family protein [Xanthobacteraceae bacterium]
MTNIAILVGNTAYQNLNKLECCHEDVVAIKELLDATESFAGIEVIENANASELKDAIRNFVDKYPSADEIFFYFTGHGLQHEAEFFFCAKNFDSKRPNETGLSNDDLHTLLKHAKAELIVKVVDACSSGALLVKSDFGFLPVQKNGFKHLIQIASCLDSQTSLTGHPLSPFTEKFRAAALRKEVGPVYYTDIIDTLRDEYLGNNLQTPHFVSQGTGRELFVDNGRRLDDLRAKLNALAITEQVREEAENPQAEVSIASLLQANEDRMASKEAVQKFIDGFFDELSKRLSDKQYSEYFEIGLVEHANFQEDATRNFIVRALSNETRPDNFVTARTIHPRRGYPWNLAQIGFLDSDEPVTYELKLNCSLERAQLKVILTPKYLGLKQFVLIVTCAPSLEVCYVFELVTQHALRNWEEFDVSGKEITRQWYKMRWTDATDGLIRTILEKLSEVVQEHLEEVAKKSD